jgi:tRNA dimethylallyltransferase
MGTERVILIAGPTASGKSGLALVLAERLGGTIINADSMQVYRELRVLTARPTEEDEARAPHLLYGFVSGAEPYSAGRYMADAARAIAQVRSAGRVPIVVGGTGLYFKVLLEGLSPVPPADPDVRAYWRGQAAARGSAELHAILTRRDPDMAARLRPSDPQRIVRALEVLETTGVSLAKWQRQPGRPVLRGEEAARLLLIPERSALAASIDQRFDAMLHAGALEEVGRLLERNLSGELPMMRALGVAPLAAHLKGRLCLLDAVIRAKQETGQFAKRQLTWFRRNMIAWKRFCAQHRGSAAQEILAFIDP